MNNLEQLKRELFENKNKCIQIEKKIEELEKQEIKVRWRAKEDEDYWYLRTYGNFNPNVDWYDFGCLVQLGYKWIKDGCFNDNPELLGGENE